MDHATKQALISDLLKEIPAGLARIRSVLLPAIADGHISRVEAFQISLSVASFLVSEAISFLSYHFTPQDQAKG